MFDEETFQEQKEDPRVVIRFGLMTVQNHEKSKEAGRPIYDEVESIEKQVIGHKDRVHREIRPEDKVQFERQYKAWKDGLQDTVSGTPLKDWTPMPRPLVEELAHWKIKTLEQLAAVTDEALSRIGPFLSWREKAKVAIAKAKDEAPTEKMRLELEDRDNTIATMQRQLQEATAAIAELKKTHKK